MTILSINTKVYSLDLFKLIIKTLHAVICMEKAHGLFSYFKGGTMQIRL